MSLRSAAQLLVSFLDDEAHSQETKTVSVAATSDTREKAIHNDEVSHDKMSIDSALGMQHSDTESDTEILPAVPKNCTQMSTRAAAQRQVSFLDEVSPVQIPHPISDTVTDATRENMLHQSTPCLTQTNSEPQNTLPHRHKRLLPRQHEV